MRRSVSRILLEPVGTDPHHGESCGHYNSAPKLGFSLGNQMIAAAPFFKGAGRPSKAILGTSSRTDSYSVGKLKSAEPANVPHGASE